MSDVSRLTLVGLLVVALGGALPLETVTAADSSGDGKVARLLPAELPAELPSGTIDTPMGQARWVHLSGDISTLPDPLQPMFGPAGLIWFDGGGMRYVSCEGSDGQRQCATDVPPRLWTSDDVISARVEHPLPVEAASAELFVEGDTYWLTTDKPDTLWRSADLASWEPIDVTDLDSPRPIELAWDGWFGAPATSGDISLVQVSYFARDAARLVGHPGLMVHLEADGPGRYLVQEYRPRRDGGERGLGSILVEETSTGIRFADEDGTTLSELSGVGLDFVETWAARGSIEERRLGILEGSALTSVDTPWVPTTDPDVAEPALFPVNEGFLAFQMDADRNVRTWRSEDGRSWTVGDRVRGPDGVPLEAEWVSAYPTNGTYELSITTRADPDGDGRPDQWRSDDGVTWALVDPGSPNTGEDGLVTPVPGGSLRLADDGSWSATLDGTTWVDVPEFREVVTKWMPDGAGSSSYSLIGDALFFSVDESEGSQQRDLWIFEFEPVAP